MSHVLHMVTKRGDNLRWISPRFIRVKKWIHRPNIALFRRFSPLLRKRALTLNHHFPSLTCHESMTYQDFGAPSSEQKFFARVRLPE